MIKYLAHIIALSLCLSLPARADDFVLSMDDQNDIYFFRLLQETLKAADGDHTARIHRYSHAVPQSRVLRAILSDTSPVNIIFTGHSLQREQHLRQIDIPLLRGLLGYRLFAIRKEDAQLFARMKTLGDLTEKITLGSGTSWPDTYILKNAGFQITTGKIDNLWRMLHWKRFKALPMGMHEIGGELQRFQQQLPNTDLTTEKTIMLYYHFDYFFYVAPNDKRRAGIIEQGLRRLYENGGFMRLFESDPKIQQALAEAARYKRKVIHLENPLNSKRVQAIPDKYWLRLEKTY